MRQRRIADATLHFEKAVSLIETDYHSWAILVTCYEASGNREGVLRGANMMLTQSKAALTHDPSNGAALGICAGALAILGETERARDRIERALLIDPDNLNMRYNFACILSTYMSDPDAALDLLEPVFASSGESLIYTAEADPDMDNIRAHPRFQRMLAEAKARLDAAGKGGDTTIA